MTVSYHLISHRTNTYTSFRSATNNIHVSICYPEHPQISSLSESRLSDPREVPLGLRRGSVESALVLSLVYCLLNEQV